MQRTLLFTNEEKAHGQKAFLEGIKPKLNELLSEYYKIGINVPFDIADLKKILNNDALSFIKEKALPITKNVEINSIKLKPANVFEMMDFNTSDFQTKFIEVQSYLRDQIKNSTVWYGKFGVSFESDFFTLKDNSFEIEEEYFNQWAEKKCNVYANGEAQIKICNTLTNLCKALNSLKDIAPSKSVDRGVFFSQVSTETLKRTPERFINEELSALIKVEAGQFVVNHEFIVKH